MRKIGYTTGVFDLFHIGHLNILRHAKEHCDHLIVGVSTDELVENYKHKKPVIPYEERLAIVASIKYVDEAVTQDNLDKIAAWEKYKYSILFHGSDWLNSKLYSVTQSFLSHKGAEIMLFPYTQTTSSTLLTKAITELAGRPT